MDRKDFLINAGIIGIGSIIAVPGLLTGGKAAQIREDSRRKAGSCVVIPRETAGPFTMDLSRNPGYFRQDITEGRPGTPLNLVLNIVNVNKNCSPLSNARVDVWHCDKDGVYSGFPGQPGGMDTSGKTFFRGIQLTDKSGKVNFKTIYPGWYYGRVTHIHLQVFLNDGLAATAQMAFPDDINARIYDTPLYSKRGRNKLVPNNESDRLFKSPAGGLRYEICTITANPDPGGYNAVLNVGIDV